MRGREFSNSLERGLMAAAILMILVGAVVIELVGWKVVGWILVIYGAMTVYLAYQLIVAPCIDDFDACATALDPRDSNADFWRGWAAIPPESSSVERQFQELANQADRLTGQA
jgi:hypothetical protein